MGYLAKNKNLRTQENAFKSGQKQKLLLVGTIKLMGTELSIIQIM